MAKPRSTAARPPRPGQREAPRPSAGAPVPPAPNAERKGSLEERRRDVTAETLRTLDVEIEVRRAELASLERSRDLLERAITEHPDKCDQWHPEAPCAGLIHARWCRACGETIRRCEEHGGIRAATYYIKEHLLTHGSGWGQAESATDARRLQEQTEAASARAVRG